MRVLQGWREFTAVGGEVGAGGTAPIGAPVRQSIHECPGDGGDADRGRQLVEPVGGVGTGERGVEARQPEHEVAGQMNRAPQLAGEAAHGERRQLDGDDEPCRDHAERDGAGPPL